MSPFDEVKNIFWCQQVGQVKTIRQRRYSVLESCLLVIRDNLNVIEDEVIRKSAQRIDNALVGFIEGSREMAVWESANVTSYARRKHRRLTLNVGSFEISPWAANPDYQALMKLTAKSVSLYFETLVTLVSHIEPMIFEANYEPLINQISRFKQQVADYRLNLEVGFQEYVRIKAKELSQ